MPNQPTKGNEAQIKKEIIPRSLLVPIVSYEEIPDVSEIEIQQKLDRVFGIIFDEVVKRREEKNRQLQTGEYILQKNE